MENFDKIHFVDNEHYYDEDIDIYHIDEMVEDFGRLEEQILHKSMSDDSNGYAKRKIEIYMEEQRLQKDLHDVFDDDYFG